MVCIGAQRFIDMLVCLVLGVSMELAYAVFQIPRFSVQSEGLWRAIRKPLTNRLQHHAAEVWTRAQALTADVQRPLLSALLTQQACGSRVCVQGGGDVCMRLKSRPERRRSL